MFMCMVQAEMLAILSNMAPFLGLTAMELEPLMRFAQVDTVKPGDTVIAEGQPGKYLFLVLEGCLKEVLDIYSRRYRVSSIYLNTLVKYDCFGEYSLLDAQPISASVIAITPARLLKLSYTDFENWLAGDDRIAKTVYRNLLQLLTYRLRQKDLELDLDIVPVTA